MLQKNLQATEFVLGPCAGHQQGALAILIASENDAVASESIRRLVQEEGRAIIRLHLADPLTEAALDVFDQLTPGDAAIFLCRTLLAPSEIDSVFAEAWTLLKTLIELLTLPDRPLSLSVLTYALGEGFPSLTTEAFTRHAPDIVPALQGVPVQQRHREAARRFRQISAGHSPQLEVLAEIVLSSQASAYQQAASFLHPPLSYLSRRTMFGVGTVEFNACALRPTRAGRAVLIITLDDPDDANNELCHRFLSQRFALDAAFINIPAAA